MSMNVNNNLKPNINDGSRVEYRRKTLRFVGKYGTVMGLFLMIGVFSAIGPHSFATFSNFLNIFNQGSLAAIIAVGLTAVVIVGEFDMSIGYIASFAGVLVTGFMVNQHMPMAAAITLVLLVSLLIGFVNGLIVTKAKVSSVISTIGIGGIVIGLNYAYSNGAPISTGVPDEFLHLTLIKLFNVIPIDIIYMLIILLVLWTILNRTELGQRIQAVGGNKNAAKLSGIYVDMIKIIAFMISAFCAGVTGILLASLIGSGTTSAGDSYLINAFAAVFLGSATLKDGEFHVLGTFIGVFIIGIGFNGLAIFGVPTFFQYIFQGVILVGAVALSTVARVYAQK
ncbi:MAG: ABC transporter permease [Paenibacillaceae bacterium]